MNIVLEEADNDTSYEFDLTVFIPCLNEEYRVIGALDNIFESAGRKKIKIEAIVFDDGSTDSTARVVERYILENPLRKVKLIILKKNRGLGLNFIDGAFLAKGRYYRAVAGDNYEFPESHDSILESIGEIDIILPIYVDVKGRSITRTFVSGLFTRCVNFASGRKIKYYNGFAVYKTWQVRRYAIESSGFGFQAELITRLVQEGATYKEIMLPATAQPGSKAISIKNFLSVSHSLFRILARRVAFNIKNTVNFK
jgi:dolichol-phosphate mannosyltransferase